MKKLFVVRHAKSSWDNPDLEDFDRPLNKRGKQDAPEMGGRLSNNIDTPDLLLTSPAKRAKKTASKIAKKIDYNKKDIAKDKRLYHAGIRLIKEVVKEVDDRVDSLMIFGHNPGFTDFVNNISDASIDNIPTCGVVAIEFDISSWKQIDDEKGAVTFFDYPKKGK